MFLPEVSVWRSLKTLHWTILPLFPLCDKFVFYFIHLLIHSHLLNTFYVPDSELTITLRCSSLSVQIPSPFSSYSSFFTTFTSLNNPQSFFLGVFAKLHSSFSPLSLRERVLPLSSKTGFGSWSNFKRRLQILWYLLYRRDETMSPPLESGCADDWFSQ